MNRQTFSLVIAVVLTCSLQAGCGPGLGTKQSVSGQVTLQGEPLDQGSIQFSPKAGTTGSMSGAEIKNGAYSVEREIGLEPGVYEVRVYSAEAIATDATALPGESGPVAQDRIPPSFNSETTLEFTVNEGKANEFNVDIP